MFSVEIAIGFVKFCYVHSIEVIMICYVCYTYFSYVIFHFVYMYSIIVPCAGVGFPSFHRYILEPVPVESGIPRDYLIYDMLRLVRVINRKPSNSKVWEIIVIRRGIEEICGNPIIPGCRVGDVNIITWRNKAGIS